MSGGGSSDGVGRSRRSLAHALRTWDPGDAAQCREACRLLEAALTELESVRVHVEDGGELQSVYVTELTLLRDDAARLTRLIDTSYAFFRGLGGFVREECGGCHGAAFLRA